MSARIADLHVFRTLLMPWTAVHRLVERARAARELKAQARRIARSGLFDRENYLRRYPDVAAIGTDPILHFLSHGASEGRDPSDSFQITFYLENYPDVAASGMNPLLHYIDFGRDEGRRARSSAPDHEGAGQLAHGFARRGKREDVEVIAQSGLFDRGEYLQRYPAVDQAGIDPIFDYLEHGGPDSPCALFDSAYYLRKNPDVAASGMDAFLHFCKFGWKELRNPSADFDMAWYWFRHLAETQPDANPLAHYLAIGRTAELEIRAADQLLREDKDALAEVCGRLLRKEDHDLGMANRIGRGARKLGLWAEAEAAFRLATSLSRGDAAAHNRLATVLERQGKWWQVVNVLKTAIALDGTLPGPFYRLGEAEEKMNRFGSAADAFRHAIDLNPENPLWHYRLGYAYEKSDQPKQAGVAYLQAILREPREEVRRVGIGVFHQERGYWPEAADAYAEQLKKEPQDAELYYRLGMAHDRCYRWTDAQDAYRSAIALKPDVPYWHYRHGFVLARQEKWLDAAEAYAAAAILSPKPVPYWHYRRGYVLAKAGKHEEACLAYIRAHEQRAPSSQTEEAVQSARSIDEAAKLFSRGKPPDEDSVSRLLKSDWSNAHLHYLLGEARERRGDWIGAADAYADAVARSNPHPPAWYYRLGVVLVRANRFEEACDAFRKMRLFGRPYGVDTDVYTKDPATYQKMQYRECSDTLPIQPCTVLYESTHGASVGGNPYAIFEYLLSHPDYRNWAHVWVIARGTVIPEHMRGHRNVILAEYESDLYRSYVATASHLINDSTFPYWFSRRPEQKYLNTWHGTPLKTLGKPIRADEEFLSHRNIQRNLLHATHLISPNLHTSDVLMNDFDVRGIFSGKLAEIGYPRVDRTLNASSERIAAVCARLNLKADRPVVLYAPTWRGIFGHTEVDVERLRSDLAKLAELPCQWIFRGHPFSEELLRNAGLPVAIVPPDIDTADVLAVTDILVTDYSSIFFDFLPMRRPIFHYCYDLEDYVQSRGMYFDIHDMPGAVCRDIEALVASVRLQLTGQIASKTSYDTALQKFCPHEDGRAAARTTAFFFGGDDSHVVDRYRDTRPSLLFFAGHFAPNGINASFLNLMSALRESRRYRVSVAVEPRRIKNEPAWLAKFRELPDEVTVLGRCGSLVNNAEQAWVAARFQSRRWFPTDAMRNVFNDAYRQEYRRLFGDARIDVAVDFDGYNGLWTNILGPGAAGKRNACWMHNDLFEEFCLRYPNLRIQFSVYGEFETLVSVSRHMADINRNKLAGRFGLAPGKFRSCVNLIDADRLRQLARGKLEEDLKPWLASESCFLTSGRLSPEKDHAKLIDAFVAVHTRHPEARLLILGEGPLRPVLEEQIKRIGLEGSVYLAGMRSNPFPALQHCRCFVLSSNHEGQPMVLLEAMALGKPIIATDIDGNRGLLNDGYGDLVENSVAGLENGMLKFLRGELIPQRFSPETYRATALREFDAVISQ